MSMETKRIILGISGASGAIYGQRLVDLLEKAECRVHVIVTKLGAQILQDERGVTELTVEGLLGRGSNLVQFHENEDLMSPLASGSYPVDGMVICPCSSHSVAAIAAGLADTLLLRAAYVNLKQRRRLILVHREIPVTTIDLENMKRIAQAGGVICPASPAFYAEPETIHDLVDSVAGRVLDLLEVDHDLPIRWNP
jgi:4-hydroxy-3-polyprenylbenzoate decarboxylase